MSSRQILQVLSIMDNTYHNHSANLLPPPDPLGTFCVLLRFTGPLGLDYLVFLGCVCSDPQ